MNVLFGLEGAVFCVHGLSVTVQPGVRLYGCSAAVTRRLLSRFATAAAARLSLQVSCLLHLLSQRQIKS